MKNEHLYSRKRKFTVNQRYFKTIDSEEKAYILGFLYADGYNNEKTGCIEISLHNQDKDILDKINTCLSNERPLKVKDQMYRLVICSKKMSYDLKLLGCGQAKTFKLEFPTEEQVPSYLIRHFIRGYFDGDGCVYLSKTNSNRSFQIIGREVFLKDLQESMMKSCSLLKTKFYNPSRSNKEIVSMTYCGKIQCTKIREWLYGDATIYLQRKYDKFFSI